LAVNTVFQAYLTTFLVDPGFEKSITSVEEIFTSGINMDFLPHYLTVILTIKPIPKMWKFSKVG
jgi:hypothetical protein